MDRTETYQNMVACREIQSYVNNNRLGYPPSHPDVGDMVFIKAPSELRFFHLERRLFRRRHWIYHKYHEDKDILAFVTDTNGGRYGHNMVGFDDWDAIQVYVPIAQEWFAVDQALWLPYQHQLQEMVTFNKTPCQLSSDFYSWHTNQPWGPLNDKFSTMEQLWLGFVMKELHNKVWNGEAWIDSH